ncbi:unnamed protein product [Caenorhabditis sp. 36 PRJEB53466]|nr:unnamed protein product [Caenorhabditis sp. 36 PRJEB53466]
MQTRSTESNLSREEKENKSMSNAPETGALRRKSSLHIRDTRIAGLYDLEKTIGQGHFAVVKLAKHVFTGEMVAVKIIDKTKMDEASTSQIMKEVRCMKLVQHANIVRLYEVLDTQTKIFLILELGDYDLHDFIIKHEKGVCESLAQQYFCQIMTAIDYCHQLHVVHRDLKPENVVFFEKLGMVKLTDFGFSNSYEPGEQLSTSCGSLAYSAPEILLGDSYDAPAVDVWSLGVILYMLVCGRLPFQEANDSETLTKILDCKYSIPDVLSAECKHLIQSMLVREPQKRASLDKIVSSSWVKAGDRGLSTAIPLIVRHHLPASAHATIIEQMVAGGVASEENILRFLENDDYNSVTATYYLLAEKVLALFREEQARELLAKHVEAEDRPEVSENSVTTRSNVNSRCRSRSNSWRARPCSILKEESEEELSSYLRSASRQSSRFYPLHDFVSSPRSASRCCSAQLSRQNSEEAVSSTAYDSDAARPTTFFIPAPSSANSTSPTTPTTTVNRFEDVLSPIDEREGSESDVRRQVRRSVLNEIVDDSLNRNEEHAIRKSSDSCLHAHHQLLRSASAKRLLRRNSSPSVSMFSGISRDRVSPQAVQELLDLNRLGGGRGRAASPESVRSSRSPSPPASSSGRTSPAMSAISSMSRLKVSSVSVTNSGMRKLSSSPHLLGICEETEDGNEVSQTTSGRHLRALDDRGGRTNSHSRSASTGLVHIPSRHHSIHATKSSAASLLTTPFTTKNQVLSSTSTSSGSAFVQFTPNTYSAVRSIRPRQAIVSPDVLRRYDPHQRFIVRSKRSASCSSSDASDDDDGRRLTMLSSKCASKFDERNKKDDDDEADGGMAGKRGTSSGGPASTLGGSRQSNSQAGITPQNNEKRSTLNDAVLPLRPIPEMTLLDQTINSPESVSIRNRILHTSLSTQSMIRKWTEMDSETVDCSRWYGTPPRDYEERMSGGEKTPWLRTLRRTASSQDLIREINESDKCSEQGEDSACSTEKEESANSSPLIQNMYNDSKFSFLHTLPMEKWPLKEVRISENTRLLEEKWSKSLVDAFNYSKTKPSRLGEKKYILSMFPYPSGRLHIGHMRVYTISDATARYYRLNGYEVIHPIGWDSFGLPAENAARDKGVDPREWTVRNIEAMREQLIRTRILFDWEREISTCEPEFFRWTQLIFCRLFEHGLVKRTTAEVNWDPVDKTVLAAEQIDNDGRSWRSGAKAEKKKLRQWMVETPKYATRLQEGLRKMSEQWGEVADIQSNWIGKCDVFRFMLPIHKDGTSDEYIDLRVHDIFQIANAQFLVIKQSHPLAHKQETQFPYKLPSQVLNGVSGRQMSVIVVEDSYRPETVSYLNCRIGDFEIDKELVAKFGIQQSKHKLNLTKNDIQEIAAFGGYGGYETSRTLSDWVVSRQRGWGTPIPMVQLENGKRVAVPTDKLPVLGSERGEKVEEAKFGMKGTFDEDTLDTFFDSAWYYLRYLDNKNGKEIISKEAMKKMPVDVYVGGIEHAAVHMFFARFIAYFLNDIGVIQTAEPFTDLIPQGIVRGRTFIEKESGKYLMPSEVCENSSKLTRRDDEKVEVEAVYEKMSKSKNNGVDLAAMLDSEGVDMTRLRLLEAAAPRAPINWGETDLKGIKKLLDRIATINSQFIEARSQGKRVELKKETEELIKETYNFFVRNVGMCLEVLHLHNTALMRLQGFTNALKKIDPVYLANSPQGKRAVESLTIMLQVFCPHVSAEMWSALSSDGTIVSDQKWPQVDDDAAIEFLLMIDGVSAGRPSVDRRTVEEMSLESLWERAKSNEHSEMLRILKEEGLTTKEHKYSARKGFHVCLSCSLEGDKEENRKRIGKILDRIQTEKRRAEKKSSGKRKRKENEK